MRGEEVTPYYSEPGITIYHGDCRDILPHLPKVDLVLTDPPYGINLDYGICKDSEDGYWEWFLPFLQQLRNHSAAVVFTHRQNALRKVTDYDWVAVWNKPMAFGHRIGKWLPHWEPIFIYGVPNNFSFDVFTHTTAKPDGHPSPKPIKLMRHILEVFSDGTILDPFMGSGTTLVAAKQLGRRAIGIEIEEKYVKIAIDRLRQEVLPLNTPESYKEEQMEL